MLHEGDKVIVGLSGGADSCALLWLLCSLRESMGFEVYACHINHQLRGEEADRDEEFSRELCKRLDVELFVLKKDVGAEAKKRKIGTEQCGREIRYEFFAEKAEPLGAKIATAHTASDNAETVLFNLVRGSGLSGLCGIPPVRDNIIRPLIGCTREETESYCRKNGIDYVTDSSNLGREYTRNKLRLDVMPTLREINPSFESAVCGMSERLRDARSCIDAQAEAALGNAAVRGGYSMKCLSELPAAVFSSAVRKLCTKYALIPEAKHIELMRKIVYNGGAAELRNGLFAVGTQGIFRITQQDDADTGEVIAFGSESPLCFCGKRYDISVISRGEYENIKKIEKKLFSLALDYDTIPLTSVFRSRQSGDTFAIPYRNITKHVRKLFTEMKLPKEERQSVLLLADGNRVLWISGVGPSSHCMINDGTGRVLLIKADEERKTDG